MIDHADRVISARKGEVVNDTDPRCTDGLNLVARLVDDVDAIAVGIHENHPVGEPGKSPGCFSQSVEQRLTAKVIRRSLESAR